MKKFYPSICSASASKSKSALAFFLLMNAFMAAAQTGTLDPTFGDSGRVITSTGTDVVRTSEIVLQKDSKVVLLANKPGSFLLIRYNSSGAIDSSFGEQGVVTGNQHLINLSMALQNDEKILISGFTSKLQPGFRLSRYLANGRLDSSFGVNGMAIENFTGYETDSTTKVVVKPSGKILVLGEIKNSNLRSYLGLVQFNENGTVDRSFGTDGRMVINHTGTSSGKIALKLFRGKTFIAYCSYSDSTRNTVIAFRINDNGSIDSTFNSREVTRAHLFGRAPAKGLDFDFQPDGKMIVLVDSHEALSIYFGFAFRLNVNGTPDKTFGIDGNLVVYDTQIGKTYINYKSCNTVKVQPDGKILISGGVYIYYDMSGADHDFFLSRYEPSGKFDRTFGRQGVIVTEFPGKRNDVSSASLIQPDGKIILAGYTDLGNMSAIALARYEQNARLNYNNLQGSAFIDYNKNGIRDPNEMLATNTGFSVIKPGIDTLSIRTSRGNFITDVDTGSYIIKANTNLSYYSVSPTQRTITNSTYFNTDSVSFALQPINGNRDISIRLIPITVARPGFDATYNIAYINQGTDTISTGTIELIKSSKLNFLNAAPAATSVNGDTIRWTFSNLKPNDTSGISINLKVKAPPLVNNGDTLRSVATINPSANDLAPADNTSTLLQRVTGSFDPNDKTENHGGKLRLAQVQQGDYLTYTVRFQNTGTDTAFNVFIRDTLSNNVDWSTLKMISSSHNFELTVNDENKCAWAFNNINLVDSNKNEKLSHGYLVYSVKVKTSLVASDAIDNTAHIYFDYNLPVQTNTERTIVESTTLPVKLVTFTAKRAGRTNVAEWSTSKETDLSYFDLERSTNGTTFTTIGTQKANNSSKYAFTDQTPAKSINYYRLKAVDKDGKHDYSAVRAVNNSGNFYVNIFPNPVKEKMVVKIDSEKRMETELQIVNVDGKVVLTKKIIVQPGQLYQPLYLSHLGAGNYFLKITTPSLKDQTVIKFQKL